MTLKLIVNPVRKTGGEKVRFALETAPTPEIPISLQPLMLKDV